MPKSPLARPSAGDRLRAPLRELHVWARGRAQSPAKSFPERLARFAAKFVQLVPLVARLEVVKQLQLHAQALTYDTLLALVPLFVVITAFITGFGGMDDVRDRLETLLIGNLSGSEDVQAAIAEHVHRFVGNIRTGSLGVIPILLLVWSVLSLLGHIEGSFNTIFGSKAGRPFAARLVTYWAALTLGPLLRMVGGGEVRGRRVLRRAGLAFGVGAGAVVLALWG